MLVKKLAGDSVWERTYLSRFLGGLDGLSRSSSLSVAPILHLPRGFPFLSYENHVAPVRETVVH